MINNSITETVIKLNCALNLQRRITGVKFLFNEEEYKQADAQSLTGKIPYCVMVKSAMSGNGIKASAENFGCNGGAKALGMIKPDELSSSGRFYNTLGLYCDLITSKNVINGTTFCDHKAYGVLVKPIETFTTVPDVVLIVTNPYNSMRIIQGYTYSFGINTSYKMSGNQAVCAECTSYPFENNDINISLLCAGTRYNAGWGDDEMIIGFPFNKLIPITEGIMATLNPVEPDPKKSEIENRFNESAVTCPEIIYGKNYYTGLK